MNESLVSTMYKRFQSFQFIFSGQQYFSLQYLQWSVRSYKH